MSTGGGGKSKAGKETDWLGSFDKLKTHQQANTLNKLFDQDDQLIFELIKILYEDIVDSRIKLDILMTIEQEGCGFINKNSVDQVIAALVDIYETEPSNPQIIETKKQLLLTVTTIFIENDEFLEQQLGYSFISKLFELLQKANNVSTRRLRAMACSCLTQIEDWKPGILWKWKDLLSGMARTERTDVCQDYILLLITVIKNSLEESSGVVRESRGILQTVSYTMDHIALLTGPGALSVLHSVVGLVHKSPEISPSVFKPFMLQSAPCMDPCILFLMLFIQNKFPGEVLSHVEEETLLLKAVGVANHAAPPAKTRLLILHLLTSYVQQSKGDNQESFLQQLYEVTHPTVFDPLVLHSCKLFLHILCTPIPPSTTIPSTTIATDISQDVHYLNQLAETTGGIRVTRALYYILYAHIWHHSCEQVHSKALSITKKLFQKFPHLIPLIVNFLQTLQTFQSEKKFHLEILSLLHHTVLSVPLTSLLSNYQNFLQVWILSAQDPSMHLQKQLRRMLELAREAHSRSVDDWLLGSLLVAICRTMVTHHHTDIFYSYMGDLLFYMMHHFTDPDIRDYARFVYALLTLTSNTKAKEILNADVVDGLKFGESLANFFPGSMVQVASSDIRGVNESPFGWSRKRVSVELEEVDQTDEGQNGIVDSVTLYIYEQGNLKAQLKCELTLSIIQEAEPDALFAVTLDINNEDQKLSVEDIHIPFMTKKATSDAVFKFHPKVPIPSVLNLRSFYTHEKTTFQCDLDPLHLTLADFMMPFPWHVLPPGVEKRRVFDSLWQRCTTRPDGKGVESVKIVSGCGPPLADLWKDAQVTDGDAIQSEARQETGADYFLFLLVPSFHLLFRTKRRSTDTVVELASDFPPILDHIDEFLDDLATSQR